MVYALYERYSKNTNYEFFYAKLFIAEYGISKYYNLRTSKSFIKSDIVATLFLPLFCTLSTLQIRERNCWFNVTLFNIVMVPVATKTTNNPERHIGIFDRGAIIWRSEKNQNYKPFLTTSLTFFPPSLPSPSIFYGDYNAFSLTWGIISNNLF